MTLNEMACSATVFITTDIRAVLVSTAGFLPCFGCYAPQRRWLVIEHADLAVNVLTCTCIYILFHHYIFPARLWV
ncbi:hypothetical protein BD289DRAFT_446278 [Coniella lustricola]|uniref:Uncharacterized protein n=1 Tax=Coniella lustricola TaxID=2025994 RepID=A0A2T2ZU64_9PEZI|nr:hypothetical protein BD289DRAFT_446278 [Coniella lustricola]